MERSVAAAFEAKAVDEDEVIAAFLAGRLGSVGSGSGRGSGVGTGSGFGVYGGGIGRGRRGVRCRSDMLT